VDKFCTGLTDRLQRLSTRTPGTLQVEVGLQSLDHVWSICMAATKTNLLSGWSSALQRQRVVNTRSMTSTALSDVSARRRRLLLLLFIWKSSLLISYVHHGNDTHDVCYHIRPLHIIHEFVSWAPCRNFFWDLNSGAVKGIRRPRPPFTSLPPVSHKCSIKWLHCAMRVLVTSLLSCIFWCWYWIWLRFNDQWIPEGQPKKHLPLVGI